MKKISFLLETENWICPFLNKTIFKAKNNYPNILLKY